MRKLVTKQQFVVLAVLAVAAWVGMYGAHGGVCLYLTPDGVGSGASVLDPLGPIHFGNENSNAAIKQYLEDNYGLTDDDVQYKQNYGGSEEGDLPGSYSTTFSGDPNDFTISYTGGPVITGITYLVVKDGNFEPAWYLFDITGWDGDCGIEGTGFWPGPGGAISYVSIYGGEGVIPEPTMLLVWSGLTGLALQVRRRRV